MHWYEEDVVKLEQQAAGLGYTPEMLFYGSSTIRMWDSLYEDFGAFKPVNLGFGGSTLEACVYFFQRIMQPYQSTAKELIIYAGDNDLGDGKQPEEVLNYFTQLGNAIRSFFNKDIKVYYVSIKPSIARWNINDKIVATNDLIKNAIHQQFTEIQYIDVYPHMLGENGHPVPSYFLEDGLHLTPEGYTVWRNVLQAHFATTIDNQLA